MEKLTAHFVRPVVRCKQQLRELLRKYPHIVQVTPATTDDPQGAPPELRYARRKLLEALKDDKSVLLTSFERSLKHAGMQVVQSTHGFNDTIKIWRMRPKAELKRDLKKESQRRHRKKKKTVDSDDDSYEYRPTPYFERQAVKPVTPPSMVTTTVHRVDLTVPLATGEVFAACNGGDFIEFPEFTLDDSDLPPAWRFQVV